VDGKTAPSQASPATPEAGRGISPATAAATAMPTASSPGPSYASSVDAPAYWPMTGDRQIDATHNALNQLIQRGSTNDESQLLSALRNIFYKPIFRHIYEDRPGPALFTFCRAQLLLQAYVGNFTSPDVRRRMIDATQNLISLQDQEGQLYGPAFKRARQCDLHGQTLQEYTPNLPPLQSSRLEDGAVDKAMQTLNRLGANLHEINLMD